MRNRIFLIMATLVFWSCTKERPLVFLNETYEGFSQTQNESEPTKVVIDIPIATPKNTVSDSINLALYNFIKDVIYYFICCNSHHSYHHSIFFHFLSLFKFSFNNHYLI